MAQKHILSIGFDFPSGDILNIEEVLFLSNKSLCDADIIVIQPCVLESYKQHRYKEHCGKPVLTETDSFRYLKDIEHWKQEVNLALKNAKNVCVFMSQVESFFVQKGEDLDSMFYLFNFEAVTNYDFLPINSLDLDSKSGNQIKISQNLGCLSTYWRNFSQYSKYKAYFELDHKTTFLTTKTEDKAVGAIIPVEKGNLILLPHLEFDEELIEYNENNEECWTEVARSHGKKLLASFIEIDKALRSGQANTPPPEWSQKPIYKLKSELKLEKNISETNSKIDELKQQLDSDQAELEKEGHLKWLLYETGKPLETAIIKALKIIGFSAENYEDDESEFDAIFESEEGRFIGEAEGKDNKAINISKLSQLERELQEDFAREEVTEYAKGVLFGNAYRLKELNQRKDFFTQKFLSGAKRSKVALIRTPNLFPIAKYLKENSDSNFAKLCRQAIANTEGKLVEFPSIPQNKKLKAKKD